MEHASDASEHALRESWSANAAAWAGAVREGRIASRRAGTDAAIFDAIVALRPRRVLDVGCGEGWLARALAEHAISVVGIDGSAELIERAAALGGGSFQALSYEALIAEPGTLDGQFDAIVCNFALLGADIVPLLGALRTRLAPGGSLLIQTVHPWTARGAEPYRDGWRTETFASFGDEFRSPMPWFYRTFGAWVAALNTAGLRLVRCVEPLHRETAEPLSLLLVAQPDGAEGT